MDTTGTGQSPSTLDELLSSYFELCDRRDVLTDRLHRAETAKDSVSQRIFEKVRSEYEQELESVDSRLGPLKEELESHRRDVETEIEEAEASVREIEDEIAEAEFRFQVGEFDENHRNEIRDAITPRLDKARARRDELRGRLEAFDRRRDGADTAASRSGSDDPSDTTPADWINPREWAGASESDEPEPAGWSPSASDAHGASTGATASADVTEAGTRDADPLVALADPKVESVPDAGPGMPTLPSLVVRSGNAARRTIPLLPMTMSIGRESDNNIEIKDPDVARYHARIVYERGRFSIENLDPSSGTYVNGEAASRVDLNDGDRITVGSTELVFEIS